jgi:hypothetical protein
MRVVRFVCAYVLAGALVLGASPASAQDTFMGEEDLLRARGVRVDVVQDERSVAMMREFIAAHPELWNEDIGR